ncbi:unnamed protein product [Trichobilharzia szidati]|nr:unnamed protein product [Trichobilharzia szidati]
MPFSRILARNDLNWRCFWSRVLFQATELMLFRIRPTFLSQCLRSYSATKLATKYDVVIVGGGMVGFGLAAVAANSKLLGNKSILLLESSPKNTYQYKEEYENRVVALNDLSVNMLNNIGAWEFIRSHRAQPVNKMKIVHKMNLALSSKQVDAYS